jgi:hypothetical protein
MSGPTAATFGLDAGLLIAFEALQAANAIAEGYAAEGERQEAVLAGRAAERGSRQAANRDRETRQAQEAAAEAERRRRLAEAEALRARLAEAPVGEAPDLDALIAAAPRLAERLASFAAAARSARQLPEATLAARRALAARLLARLVLPAGDDLPEAITTPLGELLTTPDDARAESLASELRLRIARQNEAAVAAAAARVLAQSLADLGYAVDGIGETLFVEGGVAHFRKSGWGDYFVRLRVDAGRGSLNFNVVRAGAAGEDRRHEDMLAEERWCAEFPRLRETLAARGIAVTVSRMLAAGEVPVQVVDAASLPAVREEAARQPELRSMQRP